MVRVVGVDHLSIRVGDFKKSKAFYGKLMPYLGFEVLGEYPNAIGWTNGKTRLWIGKADAKGRKAKHRAGNIGFHHYAFELRSRKDVEDLENFAANELKARIVDPAGEYYDDYYAVFFLDPDGMNEGMKWGEMTKKRKKLKKS